MNETIRVKGKDYMVVEIDSNDQIMDGDKHIRMRVENKDKDISRYPKTELRKIKIISVTNDKPSIQIPITSTTASTTIPTNTHIPKSFEEFSAIEYARDKYKVLSKTKNKELVIAISKYETAAGIKKAALMRLKHKNVKWS